MKNYKGTYTGNGNGVIVNFVGGTAKPKKTKDGTISNVGFVPDLILLKRDEKKKG